MVEKKGNNLIKILVVIILILIIAVAVLVAIATKPDAVPAGLQDALENTTLTTVELSKMTEQVGELTTQKYYYKDIHEDKKEKDGFFDKEELTLILYEGIIHAGIDLQKIDYEIDTEAKKITVTLPEPEILAHEFDNKKVKSYDVKKKIFSEELSYEDSAQKFEELQKIKEEAMMQDVEFLQSVIADTETTLTNFFLFSDATKDYTIEYIETMPEIPETEPETDSDAEEE